MKIHYLEIVTPDVDVVCKGYGDALGLTFGDPVPEFGGARTAKLSDGTLGVRAPMRDTEEPVVRPYWLVDDIDAALEKAAAAGAEIAMGKTPLGERGSFAIFIQGGIQTGLWQS